MTDVKKVTEEKEIPAFAPKVEDNVAIPAGSARPKSEMYNTLVDMKIGQSFEFPIEHNKNIGSLRCRIQNAGDLPKGQAFKAVKVNDKTMRLFKVAAEVETKVEDKK